MSKKDEETKSFTVRLPKKTWVFLKKSSVDQEKSMMEIIVVALDRYKKDLTSRDTKV